MSHSYTGRTHYFVLVCTLLLVMAMLAITVSRASVDVIAPSICHGLSPGQGGSSLAALSESCSAADSGPAPVGYRLP
jgi:hypothetical protein